MSKKTPRPRDVPRKAIPPLATRQRLLTPEAPGCLVIRWSRFDFDGPWCVGHEAADPVDLLRRLKSFETMRPLQIFGPNLPLGTDYDASSIPNDVARARLESLGFGDETRISALRIGGAPRLWGFRRDPEFYAIFFDPLHEIWPSSKKHT